MTVTLLQSLTYFKVMHSRALTSLMSSASAYTLADSFIQNNNVQHKYTFSPDTYACSLGTKATIMVLLAPCSTS